MCASEEWKIQKKNKRCESKQVFSCLTSFCVHSQLLFCFFFILLICYFCCLFFSIISVIQFSVVVWFCFHCHRFRKARLKVVFSTPSAVLWYLLHAVSTQLIACSSFLYSIQKIWICILWFFVLLSNIEKKRPTDREKWLI